IKESIVVCSTRSNRIQSMKCFNDVIELAFWHTKAEVTRNSVEGWLSSGVSQTFCIGASSIFQVTQALNQYTAAGDQVCQTCYVACIVDWLFERFGESNGREQCKVGVFCFAA